MKAKLYSLMILFLVTSNTSLVSQVEQDHEILFEKAVYTMETQADLKEAIALFDSLIQTYPEDREYAANAQFHIGLCYEKLGKREAKNAYKALIQNYADQHELVARARIRLVALEQSPVSAEKKGMLVRKVWSGAETDIYGEPSPDGKYISFVDWETGNLGIYETGTGDKHVLTSSGTWGDPNAFALYSRWSPDGKRIVYDWYNDDNPAFIDLYITGLDGSEPQKIWSNEKMGWAQCYDWSPDGKDILACFGNKDGSTSIGLISVADGSLRLIKELSSDSGWMPLPKNMRFSPDSSFIAYDLPEERDTWARDIHLISPDGSDAMLLVEHPANDYLLGWIPDGNGILFASDRNGTLGAWITYKTGTGSYGIPELVKQDIGPAEPIGFTQDGSYYYCILQRMSDIYTAEINPQTGQLSSAAHKAVQQFEGYNEAPAYSPDGKHLAYISVRPPIIKSPFLRYGGNVLCIKSLETGNVREINPSLDLISYPAWSPDGKSVAVVHWNIDDRIELCLIDVQTGEAAHISKPDNNHSHFGGHMWSPSGETFYYGLREGRGNITKSWNIIARDLASGEEKTIYSSGDFFTIAISPDGKWMALTCPGYEDEHIKIISTEGEKSRELIRFEPGIELGREPSTSWTADGKYILFGMCDLRKDEGMFELNRIPVSGGEPEKLGLNMKGLFLNLDARSDGRQITFSSMEEQNITEIWVMENFLPEK